MAWIVTKWLLLLLFWINSGSTLEIDHNQLGTQGEWILLYSLFSLYRVISVMTPELRMCCGRIFRFRVTELTLPESVSLVSFSLLEFYSELKSDKEVYVLIMYVCVINVLLLFGQHRRRPQCLFTNCGFVRQMTISGQ